MLITTDTGAAGNKRDNGWKGATLGPKLPEYYIIRAFLQYHGRLGDFTKQIFSTGGQNALSVKAAALLAVLK